MLALAACGSEEAPAPSRAELADASAEAATVNGQIIYVADVELEARLKGIIGMGEPLDPASDEFDEILDQLIEVKLLAMEATVRGLDEEPEARHRLETARDAILGNILLEHIASERIDEPAIRRMYEAQVRLLEEQAESEAHLRHIQAPTKEAMDRIVAELRTIDFVVVAARRSTDEKTRMDGGDLGYMTASEAPPSFAKAMRELPQGGVSRPFEDANGWHVVKVEDVRKRRPPSLEELRGRIEGYLKTLQLDEVLKELRASAEIVKRTPPRVQRPQQPVRQPVQPAPEPEFKAQAPEGAAVETRDAPPATTPAPATPAPTPSTPAPAAPL